MDQFEKFKSECASARSNTRVQSGAHVALSAKQVLHAMRNGADQLALILHVESARKKSFAEFCGPVTVEVEGLEEPVSLLKLDHNMIWPSNQESEEGFKSLFNLLFSEEFSAKVEELREIGDPVLQRRAAKKVRSVLAAKVSFGEVASG